MDTKRFHLELYDALAESSRTGQPDPVPGPPSDTRGNSIPVADGMRPAAPRTSMR